MLIGLLLIGLGIFILVGVFKLAGPLIGKVLKAALIILVILAIVGYFVPPLHNSGDTDNQTDKGGVSVDLN